MVCHSRAANFVLGLSTAQLNGIHGSSGTDENQLDGLERLGVLRMPWKAAALQHLRAQRKELGDSKEEIDALFKELNPDGDQRGAQSTSLWPLANKHYPRLVDPYDKSADLNARARSYLHANCAVCHTNAGGGNSQINLEFDASDETAKLIGGKPVHDTFGIKDALLVAPGDPSRSVLLHRMRIRGAGQMPQLATAIVDERAIRMLSAWIEQLAAEEK
jgi:mono/diheme cytochrome c family protein